MDEYQHFERLAADIDYEGGQWIGDEFVYSKRKKKAQQTEDDRLYGVFQGTSDDEDEGFRSRKRKRQEDTRSLHEGVTFVSSGLVTDTTEAPEKINEHVIKSSPGADGAPCCPNFLGAGALLHTIMLTPSSTRPACHNLLLHHDPPKSQHASYHR
jgi:hypothetical protein